MANEDSAEVVEFLKLVEQARTEAESDPSSIPVLAEETSDVSSEPKKYKFGRKKKRGEPNKPIQVLIREVQEKPIPNYVSAAAILVALFVAFASVMTTTL